MGKIIKLLGETYVLEILEALSQGPKRYMELASACPTENTLTRKLRKLEKEALIETATGKEGKKSIVLYHLTSKGKTAFKAAMELEKKVS